MRACFTNGTVNGVNGRKFTDIATGKTLFLPAVGGRSDISGSLGFEGLLCYYWSSTDASGMSAYFLSCRKDIADKNYTNRSFGFSVRSVAD